MKKIGPPDSHYLSAAVGWLELGSPAEALAELERVSARLEKNPDVLELRWAIYAAQKNWDDALRIARTLVAAAPQRASGWLHLSYSLRRVSDGGAEKALKALLPAIEKFPKEPTIPYNLSCYACQVRRLPEARAWLKRALEVGERERIKKLALDDADLEPLWPEIKEF